MSPRDDRPLAAGAQPRVSVVMSMRDNAATVGPAIRSLIGQTLESWELIAIDDGSRDGSSQIVAAFADPRIHLVREPRSHGLATRLNQAIALARADFIARMDADDLCFPERLERQLSAMVADPSLDLIASGAVVFRDDGTLIGTLPLALTHQALVATAMKGIPMPHPTWFGRAAWFRAHPYDGGMQKAEDQDLLLRAADDSRYAALPDVLLAYRQNALVLAKILQGRRAYAGSLWRHARGQSDLPGGGRAVLGQALKAAADIATAAVGLSNVMQLRRLDPVPPATRQRWPELWQVLGPDGRQPGT